MTVTAVLTVLLLAPAAPGEAASPPAPGACQAFSRDAANLTLLMRQWFAQSTDERVLVCPQSAAPGVEAATPLYFGEGAVTQRGAVCSYLSHGLTLAGSGAAARLTRYERSEALVMALAGADCPQPHATPGTAGYIETYDVGPSAFIGIMRLWSAATATFTAKDTRDGSAPAPGIARAAAAPGLTGRSMTPEARAHLESVLPPGRASLATVTRIVRIPGSLLRHRYALFLKVPDAAAGSLRSYVIYVDKGVHGPYQITSLAETN